ncbi:MAG TPA: DNA recombination protein RmuC [Pseudolabrys sp.]|jgi:DNA recombination protein RmuC
MSEILLLALGLIIAIGVVAIIVLLLRPRQAPIDLAAEQRMAALNAQIKAMGEMLANAQSQLQQTVSHRLDTVTQHLGESMKTSTKNTTDHLQQLHSRLAVIDSAQKNITDLASQVTSLQNVLGSKQSRGAFGQGRMEIIIQDALPKGCYEFQYTLSNKARPDCCIMMPDKRPLVIDSKFPLEAVTAFREAKSDDERKQAAARLRQDINKHVTDIADKYLLPGETQDMALMFVPSESVYAELYDGFDDIVQKAYRAKVVIVSPSLLMLAVQVVQQIQKDARMRAAADKIHAEVGNLIDDLKRMSERVLKLQGHFGQANEDVRQILISSEKIEKRGARIQEVEFGDDSADETNVIPAPMTRKLGTSE